MKKIVFPIVLMAIVASAIGQDATTQKKTEGKIIFEEVQKMEIKLEGEAAAFADALPKERRSKKELFFNSQASLYQNLKNDESAEDVAMQHGGAMVQIKMMEPDNKLFADLDKKIIVEKKEFMTRDFLIEGKIDPAGWKMTGEQKMILDYPCQKATQENEEGQTTTAWFSPAIPVSAGPAEFMGLPGLVLEVEMMDGDRTITAKKIVFTELEKDLVAKPKGGKKVTREEFDKIVEEKMKEMGAEHGEGSGTFIMRIER